ncbi:hypothetical protein K9M74_03460 [Candidatus Woesearchaeota archaeon]|nr:hypothetical protein [Candidatus Woesearchaeota archaeon]
MVKAVVLPNEFSEISKYTFGDSTIWDGYLLLKQTLVHATNPANINSILQLKKLVPNNQFKEFNITTPLAAPYPNEDPNKRKNDPYIHFSTPLSTVPENSVNLHEYRENPEQYFGWDANPPFDIFTIRFYFNKKAFIKNKNVKRVEEKNGGLCNQDYFIHKGIFDVGNSLEAIVVPEEVGLPFHNPFEDKTVLVKGLTKKNLLDKGEYSPSTFIGGMNYACSRVLKNQFKRIWTGQNQQVQKAHF